MRNLKQREEALAIHCASVPLLLLLVKICFTSPALAHHPFEGRLSESFSVLEGFFSGLAHPVLGVDHCLFLLSVGLAGIASARRWVPWLLGVGLLGSLMGQFIPLVPGVEVFVGVSLIVSAFVALGRLQPSLMLPCALCHGYVLGQAMVGAEPTPLASYFVGLLIAEGLVIYAGLLLLERFSAQKLLLSGGIIGFGLSLTYGTLLG